MVLLALPLGKLADDIFMQCCNDKNQHVLFECGYCMVKGLITNYRWGGGGGYKTFWCSFYAVA